VPDRHRARENGRAQVQTSFFCYNFGNQLIFHASGIYSEFHFPQHLYHDQPDALANSPVAAHTPPPHPAPPCLKGRHKHPPLRRAAKHAQAPRHQLHGLRRCPPSSLATFSASPSSSVFPPPPVGRGDRKASGEERDGGGAAGKGLLRGSGHRRRQVAATRPPTAAGPDRDADSDSTGLWASPPTAAGPDPDRDGRRGLGDADADSTRIGPGPADSQPGRRRRTASRAARRRQSGPRPERTCRAPSRACGEPRAIAAGGRARARRRESRLRFARPAGRRPSDGLATSHFPPPPPPPPPPQPTTPKTLLGLTGRGRGLGWWWGGHPAANAFRWRSIASESCVPCGGGGGQGAPNGAPPDPAPGRAGPSRGKRNRAPRDRPGRNRAASCGGGNHPISPAGDAVGGARAAPPPPHDPRPRPRPAAPVAGRARGGAGPPPCWGTPLLLGHAARRVAGLPRPQGP
jgi:hypothetical protein